MVGTPVDGQLVAPRACSRRGVRFALATPADDAAIRRLLRDNPMPGPISLTLEREPDYFSGANIGGARDQVIVAFEDDRLVCMGRCTTRDSWVNGQLRRVGYLAELRLDARAYGRIDLVRDGYRFFHCLQETDPADVYYTSIAADNERARRLLERGLPGLPRYGHIGDLTTLLIATRRSWLQLLPRRNSSSAARSNRNASTTQSSEEKTGVCWNSATAEELTTFLNDTGSQRHFPPAWTPVAIQDLAKHDLPLESFGVIRECGEIVAAAALWDQRRFRQIVVRAYAPALVCARPLINLAGAVLATPLLPKLGSVIPHAFLSPCATRPGYENVLPELVAAFISRAAACGADYLTLALPSGDSRLTSLQRRFRCRVYRSRLYRVTWPGTPEFALDDRAVLPDVALL